MRWRGAVAGAVLMAMISVAGESCGPYFVEAVFVKPTGPDNLEDFLEAKPEIIGQEFLNTNLILAYRMMAGPALTPEERKSVLAARSSDDVPTAGLESWVKVSQSADETPVNPDHALPGSSWQTYPNCLDNSFATAARTYAERTRKYPDAKMELADWMRGQNAVFSNCSDVAQQMPAAAPTGSPAWLEKDRAYQIAAAHFYRAEWPEARSGFESVAADEASPWHDLAEYLVARCLIRQATLAVENGFEEAPMREAQQRLKRIVAGGGPYATSAARLLTLVNFRLDPVNATIRLADNLLKPGPQLGQNLIELGFALDHLTADQLDEAKKNDLVDWIRSMRTGGEDHAAERWHQTHSVTWLVAAMTHLQMTHLQKPAPELIKAAAEIPPGSPAWATVTFLRLRLMTDDAAAEGELQQALDTLIAEHASRSTLNLFTMLAQSRAQSLTEFAKLAPMQPAGFDVNGFLPPPTPGHETEPGRPTMAGLPINTAGAKRIDVDAATVLNEQLPLSVLVSFVLQSNWPRQLRFELAMAVWTRAVLLNQPQQARLLTPILIEAEPGWKPWLNAYDAARTVDDRRITGLLALMRFPSVRPYVNGGAGREEGFVGYSSYRDNWWCSGMGKEQPTMGMNSYSTSYNYRGDRVPAPPAAQKPQPFAPFVTPAMATEARQEHAELEKIGAAPAYFGKESLAWVKAHPADQRNPELLAFAFRAMRNGCNLEDSTPARRLVFKTLHTKYPHSEWAKLYPEFETDAN